MEKSAVMTCKMMDAQDRRLLQQSESKAIHPSESGRAQRAKQSSLTCLSCIGN